MEKTLKIIHEMLYETEIPKTKSEKGYLDILLKIDEKTKKDSQFY